MKKITEDELQRLIERGEGQQLEFKRSLAELETAARTIVAFANTDGGVLIFAGTGFR